MKYPETHGLIKTLRRAMTSCFLKSLARNKFSQSVFRAVFALFLLAQSLVGFSQAKSASSPVDFTKMIGARFAKQWTTEQQEKVYLHLDKPYYSAGEDIWFKGYVVNATTHLPKSLSRFLYVELVDKSNAVITRIKIKRDSLGFAGHIPLKADLQAGDYGIRAYTYWMQNAGPDFFFSKNIIIGNAIDDYVKSQITYGKQANGKIEATISFTDASKNPIAGKTIDVFQNWNNPQNKKITQVTSKDGKIYVQLSMDTTFKSLRVVDVSMSDPGNKFKTRFFLPEFGADFDVQFFPESGTLLSNELQTIAFKAIGTDGISVDVTGKIFTAKGEEVAEFSSFNKGMGKFTLQPDANEKYYAVVKSSKGLEKRFALPVTHDKGVSLHLINNRGKVYYEMKNRTEIPGNKLYLLVHSRGRALVLLAFKDSVGQVAESALPAGVVSFSVVDSLYNTYCERLLFVQRTAAPTITMQSDKPVYGKRKPVNLDFKLQSPDGKPATGTFSISVTDNKTVKQDSLSDNILTYLLLSSDIKGYIEEPGSYFKDNSMQSKEKLDVLMLTQGWRRFSTPDVVKGKFKNNPTYYMEAGQALSGKVLNILRKPSKKCGIIMLSAYKGTIKLAQTDSLGRYLIDGIEFPDSTSFILKAKKERTLGDVEIVADEDVFPKSSLFIPTTPIKNPLVASDYLRQSKEKYFSEGGMRVVGLGEVTVKAAKVTKAEDKHYYSGMEDTKFSSDKLEQYPGYSVLQILSMVAGVQVNGDQVSIRGGGTPTFYIDEIESMSMDDITYLTSEDIESISVFKGANAAIFGSKGGNGVIAIALKKGYVRKAETPISMMTVRPLGYQKPAEFYMPKYNVESIAQNQRSDLRTTIYWSPKLVADTTGTVHVKFFTADKANNYSVVLEGLSNTGEIYRYVGALRREGE